MKRCPLCSTEEYPDRLETCPKHGLQLLAPGQQDRWVGERLKDTHVIEELVGAGGMGKVYRATQFPLQRPVAVKVVEPAGEGTGMLKRFYREARLLASIQHANVVTVYDFGNTPERMFYLVMEYLEGTELTTAVPAEGLPIDQTIEIFDQLCAGVGAAHSVGMVHRDLKPSNIFLARQTGGSRIVKVMDFGLAKVVGDEHTMLTMTGVFMGTPGYVAPELIGQSSAHATERSDIYAMGAILYFLLTGEEVQGPGSAQQILARQLMEKLDLAALKGRGDLHPKMIQILIGKAMALDPAERHESCDALLEAFRFATSR